MPRPRNATLGSHWRSPAAATHCVHAQCRRAVGQPIFVRTALRGWHLGSLLSHLTIIFCYWGYHLGLFFQMTGGDLLGEHVQSDVCSICRTFRVMTSENSNIAHGITWAIDSGKSNKVAADWFSRFVRRHLANEYFWKAPNNIHLSTAILYWLDPPLAWHGLYPDSETTAQRPKHSFASALTFLKQNKCHRSQRSWDSRPSLGLLQGLFRFGLWSVWVCCSITLGLTGFRFSLFS